MTAALTKAFTSEVRIVADPLKHPWGRVDQDGTVYVVDAERERAIGQYPDGTAQEAIEYFERKFTELKTQLDVVEQRVGRGAPARELEHSLSIVAEQLVEPPVLGDIESLRKRTGSLSQAIEALALEQRLVAERDHELAIAERTVIVEKMEQLAQTDSAKTQWKQASKDAEALFAKWQEHQRRTSVLTKTEGSALWKRFRDARSHFERNRRAFFTQLDVEHREAKSRKTELVDAAEKIDRTSMRAPDDYQNLLRDWKRSGRAGKKTDDALWLRFKAAGDTIYAARQERFDVENVEYEKNLAAKRELLQKAEQLPEVSDHSIARSKLTQIQREWEEIGRVPRSHLRSIENRLRQVEENIRTRENDHWKKTDPEKMARTASMEQQIQDSISKLEADVEQARAANNTRKIRDAEEALAARKAWLAALQQ